MSKRTNESNDLSLIDQGSSSSTPLEREKKVQKARKATPFAAPVPYDWIDDDLPAIDESQLEFLVFHTERGKEYAEQVREYAYVVWSMIAGQNSVRTSLFLRYPPPPYKLPAQIVGMELLPAMDVPSGTINNWAKAHSWRQRLKDDFRAIAPDMWDQIRMNLMKISVSGSERVALAMEGIGDMPKDLVTAWQISLDRIGLTPHIVANQFEAPRGPKREVTFTLQDGTAEEHFARMRELLGTNEKDNVVDAADVIEIAIQEAAK